MDPSDVIRFDSLDAVGADTSVNSLLLLVGLLLLQLLYGAWFGVAYFLLIQPFVMFLDGRSLGMVLSGGFLAGFLIETVLSLTPGSILVGVGLAVLFTHLTVGVINWSLPIVQWVGGLLFLGIVFVFRASYLSLVYWQIHLPAVLPWIVTFLLLTGLLLVRWRMLVTTPRGDRYAR